MYDINEDEFKEMYDKKNTEEELMEKAISLTDPISRLPRKPYIVLDESVSLSKAISTLQKNHLSCVLLARDNRVSGIFTERDVLQNVVGKQLDIENIPVTDYMTLNPECLHLEDHIAYALNKMSSGGFRSIPIVDSNQIAIALVTMQDIINHLGDYFFEDIMNLPPLPLREQSQREGG